MSIDKVLHKIQDEINDLAPTLELFVDDTIQPSVNDCELLQKQLTLLQENIAVYKYQKLNKELSPSFNLHAKISAQEKTEAPVTPPAPQVKETPAVKETIEEEKPDPIDVKAPEIKSVEMPVAQKPVEPVVEKKEAPKPAQALTIGINDKFRFINILFAQNAPEYSAAIEQVNTLSTWNETEFYLNSLKNVYDWQDDDEVVKQFYAIVKKRFS